MYCRSCHLFQITKILLNQNCFQFFKKRKPKRQRNQIVNVQVKKNLLIEDKHLSLSKKLKTSQVTQMDHTNLEILIKILLVKIFYNLRLLEIERTYYLVLKNLIYHRNKSIKILRKEKNNYKISLDLNLKMILRIYSILGLENFISIILFKKKNLQN